MGAAGPTSPDLEPEMAAALDATVVALLASPEGRADPYPLYRRLHAQSPAILPTSFGPWIVTRFDDCQTVLRDPRFGKSEERRQDRLRQLGASPEEVDGLVAYFESRQSILTLDPPDHTRLRGLVSRAFTPRRVEALRPHVRSLCDGLLDGLAEAGAGGRPVDVMAELAFPLPVTVIGELLGVPEADRPQFQGLVRRSTVALEPTADLAALHSAREARTEMEAYFTGLVGRRRSAPADDLLSALVGVSDGSDRLSEMELVSTAILLFAAGFETTTNLIGNGLLALLEHPDQLARWRADRGLSPGAVEELLRWDSPVQLDGRTANEDLELAGRTVPGGTFVLTLLGAANHDPGRFHRPEKLDIGRDQGAPLSFGSGIHYCLGAALARMEGQVVFDRLIERFTAMELAGPRPRFRDSLTLRGLEELPVVLRAA